MHAACINLNRAARMRRERGNAIALQTAGGNIPASEVVLMLQSFRTPHGPCLCNHRSCLHHGEYRQCGQVCSTTWASPARALWHANNSQRHTVLRYQMQLGTAGPHTLSPARIKKAGVHGGPVHQQNSQPKACGPNAHDTAKHCLGLKQTQRTRLLPGQ